MNYLGNSSVPNYWGMNKSNFSVSYNKFNYIGKLRSSTPCEWSHEQANSLPDWATSFSTDHTGPNLAHLLHLGIKSVPCAKSVGPSLCKSELLFSSDL